jgi:hypothetical protein
MPAMRRPASIAALSCSLLLSACVSNEVATKATHEVPAISAPAGTRVLVDSSGRQPANFADAVTASFTAPSHWLIRYAFNCLGSTGSVFYNLVAEPASAKAPPPEAQPSDERPSGTGTEYYDIGGRFHLKLLDPCPWHLIVAACSPDCGHEPQPDGIVDLSGDSPYASRLIDVGPEMMVAYSYDCTAASGGRPSFGEFRVAIPFVTDPSNTNTAASGSGDAGSGISYWHLLRPRQDQVIVKSNCRWRVRVGPRGKVGAPQPLVVPPLPSLPGGHPRPGARLQLSGSDSVSSDSFSAAGAVTIAYAFQCYRYASSVLWTMGVQPADETSKVPKSVAAIFGKGRGDAATVTATLQGTFFVSVTSDHDCTWQVVVDG